MTTTEFLQITGIFTAIAVVFLVLAGCISEHYEKKHYIRQRHERESINY